MKLHPWLILVLGGCVTGQASVPPPPDATPTDESRRAPGTCPEACHALELMACPEGKPTPAGRSCADVCQVAAVFPDPQASDSFKKQLGCIARAKTLDAMHGCGVQCGTP